MYVSESVHAGIHNYALKIQKRVAGGYGPDMGDEDWSPLGNPPAFLITEPFIQSQKVSYISILMIP